MKTIEELMKKVDDDINTILEVFNNNTIKTLQFVLGFARERFYDATVYFGYSVALIELFGKDGEITIPSNYLAERDEAWKKGSSRRLRIDQTMNEDGSMTLRLAELEKEDETEK